MSYNNYNKYNQYKTCCKPIGAQGATGAAGPSGPIGLTGPPGQDGNFGGATFEYLFDISTTATDPTPTYLRLNDVSQNTATEMYIDSLDTSGSSIDVFMQSIDSVSSIVKGYVRVTKKFNTDLFLLFQINFSFYCLNLILIILMIQFYHQMNMF